jgi:hypothetical protein
MYKVKGVEFEEEKDVHHLRESSNHVPMQCPPSNVKKPLGCGAQGWDFYPLLCHHEQIYQNQAHLSIVQGPEYVRSTVRMYQFTR